MADQAFVTLATNDSYAKGALVLGASLRNHGTSRKLAVLIGHQVSPPYRSALAQIFNEVCEVSVLDSGDSARLALMRRPELGVTFSKLHCWSLTHYSKCVFMDADTLVLCNIDELFGRDELSAAPDPGWPDCFNSGVFVFRPSGETYAALLRACAEHGSFDGGDQGVLNSYFSDWATADLAKHLPFIYNLSSVSIYTYLPAFIQFGHNAKVIHFLGERKPWDHHGDADAHSSDLYPDYVRLWRSVYDSAVRPLLTNDLTQQDHNTPHQESQQDLDQDRDQNRDKARDQECVCVEEVQGEDQAPRVSSEQRKQKWERGDADYLGEDSFSHIERKLSTFLS